MCEYREVDISETLLVGNDKDPVGEYPNNHKQSSWQIEGRTQEKNPLHAFRRDGVGEGNDEVDSECNDQRPDRACLQPEEEVTIVGGMPDEELPDGPVRCTEHHCQKEAMNRRRRFLCIDKDPETIGDERGKETETEKSRNNK